MGKLVVEQSNCLRLLLHRQIEIASITRHYDDDDELHESSLSFYSWHLSENYFDLHTKIKLEDLI